MTRDDPKGLIAESYAIEGISPEACRTIFLDWALSLGPAQNPAPSARRLWAHYAPLHPTHPMTGLLTDAGGGGARPARRGGRAARVAKSS